MIKIFHPTNSGEIRNTKQSFKNMVLDIYHTTIILTTKQTSTLYNLYSKSNVLYSISFLPLLTVPYYVFTSQTDSSRCTPKLSETLVQVWP
jgi:hypothetical protein